MSKHPMGPYEYKGLIMAEHANGCWTNHHSIVNFKGQWYLFYHHNAYSPRDDKRRSVQIEKLFFNPDGTIQEVKPTLRGVGISNALSVFRLTAIPLSQKWEPGLNISTRPIPSRDGKRSSQTEGGYNIMMLSSTLSRKWCSSMLAQRKVPLSEFW